MNSFERTAQNIEGEEVLKKYSYFADVYGHDFAVKQLTQHEKDAGFRIIVIRTSGPHAQFIPGQGYKIL